MTRKRIASVRKKLNDLELDAFIVSHPPNIRYLTGFTGSNGLLIVSPRRRSLLTDSRYRQQSRLEVRGCRVLVNGTSLFETAAKESLLVRFRRVGFEGNHLPYAAYQNLRKLFRGVRFLPKVNVVESVASVKDASEIESIRKAVRISDKVFRDILGMMKPGVRELEIAAEISYRQRMEGAEGDAFDVIVASGWRSSLVHGRASTKRIRTGELVTLDFGCSVGGYHSDLTRTVAVGSPSKRAREIYRIVLEAQERAIEAAQSGLTARTLDEIARGYIRSRGYDQYFGHSLGHGLGLQVHELPKISSRSKDALEAGNVITIEPGIYIPKFGGVRIEDDVLVTNGNSVVLNAAPKDFIVL